MVSRSDDRVLMGCRVFYLVGQLSLGGLERQLFNLLQVIDRSRYKPAVVVWRHSHGDHYNQAISDLGIPVVALPSNLSGSAKLQKLRDMVSVVRPEVLHSYSSFTNFAAWWAARGTGIVPIGSSRSSFWYERQKYGRVLGRLSGRWPSAQVYNSFSSEQEARQSWTIFRPRRIYVITNGVDLDLYSAQPNPEQGYILAVGRLSAKKRWDRLIRVVAFLASKGLSQEVVHAGSGPLQDELEAMARSLHVDHLIRFLGDRHDLPTLLGGAAFLVHTSEIEGCPNVVLEAMACGRAVVATDAGDIPYLVEDGKTGFVVPQKDEGMLADRIEALLRDHELCRRMGNAGRKKAEQAFGFDRLRAETFAVYRAEGWRDSANF